MSRARDAVWERMVQSLTRLDEMLAAKAPDCLIAAELELLGETGRMLDPQGCTERDRGRLEYRVRKYAGLCVEPTCEDSAGEDGVCSAHRFH
jgi:hypothetical protein